MNYFFYLILGVFNLYLWLKNQSLQKKVESHSSHLQIIFNIIEPGEDPKPYEWRTISTNNKLKIEILEEELKNVKELALQALSNTGSIIRHSKLHPISPEAINNFIEEQGLLNDNSSS
jgi:hypothetical protein